MPASNEQASVIAAIHLLVFFAQALKKIGIPTLGITQISLWIIVLTTLGGTFGLFAPKINLSPNHFLLLLEALIVFGILTGILYIRKRNGQSQNRPRKPYRIG